MDGFKGDHDLVLCFSKWKRFVIFLTLGEIPNKLSMRERIVGVWLWLYFFVLWIGMDEK